MDFISYASKVERPAKLIKSGKLFQKEKGSEFLELITAWGSNFGIGLRGDFSEFIKENCFASNREKMKRSQW